MLDCGAIANPVLWTCILNAALPIHILFQVLMFLQEHAGVLYWLPFFMQLYFEQVLPAEYVGFDRSVGQCVFSEEFTFTS